MPFSSALTPSAIEETIETTVQFLRRMTEQTGRGSFVIGLSGGIDSAVSATLAVRAVGAGRLLGLLMPYRTSSRASVADATELATWLEIETATIDISPMIDAYAAGRELNQIRAGNKMARERMSILFDIAQERGALVLGTGNRTEIALGYTTLYGDSACSCNPIGQLYKTEVRALAGHLRLPEVIISKAPSADLWEGQTDEDELQMRYEEIDRALTRILDAGILSRSALLAEGHSPFLIDRLIRLINMNSFKRRLPPVALLGKAEIPPQLTLSE